MIKFIDLETQKNKIRNEISLAIKNVLDHGQYIFGKEVNLLERKLESFSGAKYCISCANGTDALILALMALDLNQDDVVFAPSFTYVSTIEVIKFLKGRVCFIDVDKENFNICPKNLESSIMYVKNKLKLKPKLIIAVDLFGQPADYKTINSISRQYGLKVIADGAQSFGASQGDKKVGNLAEITTTSFFPAKPLGCYGDGGAIFTNNFKIANKIKSMRNHGQGKDKYHNVNVGMNSRLDSMQAAILIEKLKIFKKEIHLRNKVADYYNKHLTKKIKTPSVQNQNNSVWAQYTLLVKKRDNLKKTFEKKKIPYAIYYPNPNHMQKPYKNEIIIKDSLKNTNSLKNSVISLPMHPYLNQKQQDLIIKTINQFYESK